MKTDAWSVYIARCRDGSLYTGISKDVAARLDEHNAGRGAAYTRTRRPVNLVYREDGFTRSAALSREAAIKTLKRPQKQALLRRKVRAITALGLAFLAGQAKAVPTFQKESAVVFSSAAPQSFTGAYPNLRMYFIRQSSGVQVGSALSADGIQWNEEGGTRLSTGTLPSVSAASITACSVLPLSGGGFRMLYSILSTTGSFRIHSATSSDGLSWANDAGTRIDGGVSFLGSPRLIKLPTGDWRLYYVADTSGGNNPSSRQVFTALSSDQGLSWGAAAVAVSTVAFEVGASQLTNNTVRLYFTEAQAGSSSGTVVASALSTDANGAQFSLENGFRVSTSVASGSLSFPVPVRSTDSFRWRLYYDFADPGVTSTASVHSALTGPPAPTAINPSTVLRTGSTTTLTIMGEIFSTPAPTLALTQAGSATQVPISVTRVDDQTLTSSFNVFNLPTGPWNLVVTNADGQTATLANALLVDFPSGDLTLTNNLLRPRNGAPTLIDVTIYNAGHVQVRIYARDGRLVRTLLDQDEPQGSLGLNWDGYDANGGAAASGVYIVRVIAPKLDVKGKIVLIR